MPLISVKLRVPMGGRREIQKAYKASGARVCGCPHELDAEHLGRRKYFPKQDRYAGIGYQRNSNLMVLSGVPFPRNFRDTICTIIRRLFRVYAHIYSNHFDQICALGIEGKLSTPAQVYSNCPMTCLAHLNTSYRHFFLFVDEVCLSSVLTIRRLDHGPQFNLVDKRELAPLDELNDAILAEGKSR